MTPYLCTIYSSFTEDDSRATRYSESFCSSLLAKMNKYSTNFQLPTECKQYPDVNNKFESMKQSVDREEAAAFVGMSPADARNAQVARRQGHLNEAQIKRRMTSRSKKSQSSWF